MHVCLLRIVISVTATPAPPSALTISQTMISTTAPMMVLADAHISGISKTSGFMIRCSIERASRFCREQHCHCTSGTPNKDSGPHGKSELCVSSGEQTNDHCRCVNTVLFVGKRALVCGYGKDCASALCGSCSLPNVTPSAPSRRALKIRPLKIVSSSPLVTV